MTSIEMWFAESVEIEGAFAIRPECRLTPNINATQNHMDAIVFADEAAAAVWCAENPEPVFIPALYIFETPHVH